MTLVEDAFRAVVEQFKDPLAFLRELVQNSLDAGSTVVDVDVRLDGELVTFEVRDTGDGMDRAVIEGKLLRMFASDKEGDATKIGKFGIGFKSVFAVRPEQVIVDTVRGAEAWRVVISEQGAWELYPLDEVLEGTRVRVLRREPDQGARARLVDDSRATVQRWCRYADADVRFCGASIRTPFALDAAVTVRVPLTAPGDELLVGLTAARDAPWGFYNKGLTLLEGAGPFEGLAPWVCFRVRDGALEHTLTRDNVIHDDAYYRVMALIDETARGPLIVAALAALEDDGPTRDAVCRAAALPAATGLLHRPAARARRPVLRDARARPVTIERARSATRKGRAVRVTGPSALAWAAEHDGQLVLLAPRVSGEAALLDALLGPGQLLHETHVAIVPAADKEQWQAAPLAHATAALLATAGHLVDVVVGRLDDADQGLGDVPAVFAADPARPVPRSTALTVPQTSKRKRASLVLCLDTPVVADALRLAETDTWLAACLLARAVMACSGDAGAEALAAACWRKRAERGA
ncbi:MAG: hypothetical protein A2138_20595 [Deltaproteobacteria bacterium RBG_16_71_12]|nr:MAG: hypothetical protein A2138_20595 [Deltaproteobacteria bacterium RBG_16_71_12]